MINPKQFYEALCQKGISFYTGVPDSLLANFCAYIDDNIDSNKHVIAANEGNSVAIAMGYHLSTGKIPAVYMQNSGIGNAINPLVSLADSEVYSIPMLLIIGWRGEPNFDDEPQHVKQGKITISQLDILGLPYWIIDGNSDIEEQIGLVVSSIVERNAPAVLVVRKDTFEKYKPTKELSNNATLSRESVLEKIISLTKADDLIISTTGKTSREVFEIRVRNKESQTDFLTVGGMGHTSSIALGVSLGVPNKKTICLDGDGSLIMHMGAMGVISSLNPINFVHVLLNNESHESVGGQPTCANQINFDLLSKAMGYKMYFVASDLETIHSNWEVISKTEGPVLFEIKIKQGSRGDLGRPTSTPSQNKNSFMSHVKNV